MQQTNSRHRMTDFESLRARHPRLVFRSYDYEVVGTSLEIAFEFRLEPDIDFHPRISIPLRSTESLRNLDTLVFNLGMVELISYWKAACPAEIYVTCGALREEQVAWWIRLFHRGLGEFFYRNGISPHIEDLLRITSSGPDRSVPEISETRPGGDLVLVGGGKDSAVVLEVVVGASPHQSVLMLNPTPAAFRLTQAAGYDSSIAPLRVIDPTLLDLNAAGYLNGHTPFSAYLAFLSVLIAKIYGLDRVIVGNERSSSQGNVSVGDFVVNHQYSKSFEFETFFRRYCSEYLTPSVEYFSLLRPLWSLQVSELFSGLTQHLPLFRSCNVAQRQDAWCGQCAKCASVFLSLSPFLEIAEMVSIFGSDYFLNPSMEIFWQELVGVAGEKPFECVATFEESRASAFLGAESYVRGGAAVPGPLRRLVEKSESMGMTQSRAREMLNDRGRHCIPSTYEVLLEDAVSRARSRARA